MPQRLSRHPRCLRILDALNEAAGPVGLADVSGPRLFGQSNEVTVAFESRFCRLENSGNLSLNVIAVEPTALSGEEQIKIGEIFRATEN